MIRVTDQYFWNFVFTVFFLLLIVMGAIILGGERRIPWEDLTFVDLTLMTLATWRLVRLFVYDAVTKFIREQFYDLKKVGKVYELQKPKTGPRRTLADLMSCPWCFGAWAGAFVVFFYQLTEYAYFPILLLAISAVASLLQILANLVGHQAEKLKRENE